MPVVHLRLMMNQKIFQVAAIADFKGNGCPKKVFKL